jgi:uncharacterized Tic20 family protein
MPPLDQINSEPEGQTHAVIAETLYLANLLLLPGIAFLILMRMYFKSSAAPALAQCHIKQCFFASVWAGFLIVIVNTIILLLGGYGEANTWVVLIIYFTTIHSTLVLLGVLGLSKAMAGKHYHYPLIGSRCSAEKS